MVENSKKSINGECGMCVKGGGCFFFKTSMRESNGIIGSGKKSH